jgi:tetratricopeptide (TPR) repeat protein
MRTTHGMLMTLLLAAALSSPALATDSHTLVAAQQLLQSGMNHGDPGPMLKARGQFLGLLAAEPGAALLHYWVAVADWRVVPMLAGKDRQGAQRYCEEGLLQCDAALKADPRLAEALAVKAGLQGLAINFNGAAAITLGPALRANMGRAVEMAPANPRIRLIDGINTLHMPDFFGGGADKALEKLKLASTLFAAESLADSTAPRWGGDDALLWAGRCAMTLRDFAAARDFFQQALDRNPDNGWVRTALLPAAADSLAKHPRNKS